MAKQTPESKTWLRWLTPGLGIKRWFGVLLIGAVLIGMGFAMLLVEIYRLHPDPWWSAVLQTMRAPLWLWALIAGAGGLYLVAMSAIRISQTLLEPLAINSNDLVDAVVEHRQRQRGPKIVAIGGGTGMPTLLRGLKAYTSNLTAIVTVADDGGSSGRLRRDLGVLPPGDFRNNIAALARDEGLITQLFQYRFGEGGLEGHSFGNLFITAMSGITGSFEQAVSESSRVLAIRGKVLPSTLSNVTLVADLKVSNGQGAKRVTGESAITKEAGLIDRIFLQPDDVRAYPEAVRAILTADLLVLGPGSLYTSILPNLLVADIARAVRASRAPRIYICNVATQRGETEGFSVLDHIRAIERQVGKGLFDQVLVNNRQPPVPADSITVYVKLDMAEAHKGDSDLQFHAMPLVDVERPWRHNSELLAQAVMDVLALTM